MLQYRVEEVRFSVVTSLPSQIVLKLQPMSNIQYPYLPTGRIIKYVDAHNPYMMEAREYAREHSLDDSTKTGSIIVKGGKVIGRGANGTDYHKTHECERVKRN